MTIRIEIYGDNAADVLNQMRGLISTGAEKSATKAVIEASAETVEHKVEKETKPKKEKVKEKEPEVEKDEAPKFVLQDAIDRAKEIAGDGKNEEIMLKLKSINEKLGVAKVREIPADKLSAYMAELNKAFGAKAEAKPEAGMFD